MCSAPSIIMYGCEQLIVASSLGAIAVTVALVAVLCCTRRPPKVGNTPLVLLLVGLLAISATLAAAAGDDEPPPRKLSRLLDSQMSPIPVDEQSLRMTVRMLMMMRSMIPMLRRWRWRIKDQNLPILGHFPPRADRTYVTLKPALPGPFEVIEEGRRRQPLRSIPQPRIRIVTTDRSSTPRGIPAVTITPVHLPPSTSRDTSQHNTSDNAFTSIRSRSCCSCPFCTVPAT
ncbi:uncharacterized protein LOC124357878 [Homalodisca vitripennis]|uniref:uncharacterized protein LOC124357878 n=1 Tax=Homalodisca vitripennis TaxID=197043 RepID=UPI001EECB9F6|nr:uncharacterized protein LOC124357878 [Homalodisca vitripennis]